MPGLDGTDPSGEGPMTGGGFGYCGTRQRPAYAPGGRGFFGRPGGSRGAGFGGGRGMRRGWFWRFGYV